MPMLRLLERNFHEVRVDRRRLLFHVPTTGLFEIDHAGGRILDLFRKRRELPEEEILRALDDGAPIREALADFHALGIVGGETPLSPRPGGGVAAIRNFPLSALVLNVTTGCNLSCTYCYKEDLETPAGAKRMDFDTAVKGVELLLREAQRRPRVSIVFFGGEPLTNLPLIRQVVDYTEKRCAELGKQVDFSLTTNALLLTKTLIDYFDAHRFGLTVSIDGLKTVHDKNRRTLGGAGTYDMVAGKARMLLERYRSRPVGARVTLACGASEVEVIFDHLKYELGFAEVGFAPVTADDSAEFGLGEKELAALFRGMKRLGKRYEEAALRGEFIGFSNLHHLVGDLHHGTRKVLPCGAGLTLLAVDYEGNFNLCHRFTGSDLPTFGDVERGIDKERLGALLDEARDLSGRDCEACHIRTLCSGGCYHERYRRYANPLHPSYHYCDLMREWVDFAIATYSRILQKNPSFFERHGQPGRYADMQGVRL